ncbi:uncharacterized protein ALTATR162_LOCUS12068 [Alternaria atra]|uniref:Uncharacterized protein n=1 Tax=Alternaria atra TaxID=119953 RepID=A0A8J2ID15_9PLEO|nr:uncharacterized protein ALTATR162_LOCUS12068 [Alternaria atra]CAG5188960.1 unnamed protein product [Alternaria atra]
MRISAYLLALRGLLGVVADSCVQTDPTPDLGYEELWRLQHEFYERWITPNNVKEAESINSTIFSDNIQGRVSDTRTFVGRELNTEYIFGLFMPSDSLSIIGNPTEYEVIQFAAVQNIASATTRVNFTFPAFNNISLPVVINTWMTWNSARQMTQYDVVFKWFGNLFQTLILSLGGSAEEAGGKTVNKIATSICNSHERYCNGTNAQYDSWEGCYNFLTKEIRVGQSFELGMNTLMCRSVHELMVKYRPGVHCSHIGPTGGGECDDTITYIEKAEERLDANSPWIAGGS